MSSSTLKNLVATLLITVVTIVESRNFNKDESEVMQLQQENSRLSQTLMDLRQNYSRLLIQGQNEQSKDVRNEDKIVEYVKDGDHCLQTAIRLLEDSIKVYDDFLTNELDAAESRLCNPQCYGNGDATCEACPFYTDPQCEVGDYVRENIVGPFRERADQLRDRANTMTDALHKSLEVHFGVDISFSDLSRE